MNKLLFLCLAVAVAFSSCAYHLKQILMPEGSSVLIEKQSNYLPNGWSGITSANYPGVLAVVDKEIVFDCPGAGSRPWMNRLESPIKFIINSNLKINLLEKGAFGKKVIQIIDNNQNYEFLTSGAEEFIKLVTNIINTP
jgi:hypothetical protein